MSVDPTIATQLLYSAAPSPINQQLRVNPSGALAEISSEFLFGTPTWYTILPENVQNYLIATYKWTVAEEVSTGEQTTSSTVQSTETISSASAPQTTANVVDPVVSSVVDPVVSGVVDPVLSTARPVADASSGTPRTTSAYQLQTSSEISTASSHYSESYSSSAIASAASTSYIGGGSAEDKTKHAKDTVLSIAIGTSLGGAFLAAVFLFVLVTILKQRRRKRQRRASMHSVVEQAAKIGLVTDTEPSSSGGSGTIRPVEAGTTPRTSWYRHSTLPEVVHEMSADTHSHSPQKIGILKVWRPKPRPVSSHF